MTSVLPPLAVPRAPGRPSAQGLSSVEAQERLGQFGPNVLAEAARPRWLARFARNFTYFFALLLWVGAGLAAGVLFKSQIGALLVHLDRIGGMTGLAVLGALTVYVAYKWWERARFYKTMRMARISVNELYDLMQAGADPIIVDVRSPTARALEPRWIPGALHVPVDAVGQHIGHLPRDREIILYCTCPSEASAARVAKILINHGFKLVRPLFGGLDAWIAAGYSVEGSAAPVVEAVIEVAAEASQSASSQPSAAIEADR